MMSSASRLFSGRWLLGGALPKIRLWLAIGIVDAFLYPSAAGERLARNKSQLLYLLARAKVCISVGGP